MKLPTKAAIIAYLGDLTFVLYGVAALPYTFGELADVLPPAWKVIVVKAALISVAALKGLQRVLEWLQGTHDREQIKVAQEAAGAPQVVSINTIAPLVALCFAMLALAGCSTTTPDPAKNARNAGRNAAAKQALVESAKILGDVAVSSLLNVAQQELGGRNADFGQAAAAGVWSNVNSEAIGSAIGKTVQAYSAGKAQATAVAAKTIADRTLAAGQPAPAVVNAIAAVISTAAGAPPMQ